MSHLEVQTHFEHRRDTPQKSIGMGAQPRTIIVPAVRFASRDAPWFGLGIWTPVAEPGK
jgi:hypothetical protein